MNFLFKLYSIELSSLNSTAVTDSRYIQARRTYFFDKIHLNDFLRPLFILEVYI